MSKEKKLYEDLDSLLVFLRDYLRFIEVEIAYKHKVPLQDRDKDWHFNYAYLLGKKRLLSVILNNKEITNDEVD